jgi:fibronectin type 3 domain-containing protein
MAHRFMRLVELTTQWLAVLSGLTPLPPPPSTVTLPLTADRKGEARLTWEPVQAEDLAGYRVYYGKVSGFYEQPRGQGLETPIPALTITGLESGATYYFAVTSYDTSGNESAYSSEVWKVVA